MPIALVYTMGVASQTKFEWGKSLKTGEIIFSSNSKEFLATNSVAVTFPATIVLHDPYKNNLEIIAHEITHIFQQNDFSQFDAFMAKPVNFVNSKGETIRKINNYIYYDFRHLPHLVLYSIESKKSFYYYDNRFEREAGYFSNTFSEWTLK